MNLGEPPSLYIEPTVRQDACVNRSQQDSITNVILDSIADGVFTVDAEWRITSFNAAAERITSVKRSEAIGRPCCDVFRASICEGACALRKTLATGKSVVNTAVYIVDSKGKRIPISISTAILKDANGKVIGGVETFRDLSQVEQLRKELQGRYTFADIVGRSQPMQQLFQVMPDIAASDSTALIEGPSGTGKETVRSGDPQPVPAAQEAICCDQLRCAAGHAAGERAVRLQGRRLHRRPQGQARSVCHR